MNTTRITIVRHGETEWNVALLLQGYQDSPLTQNGIEQAEKLAESIRFRHFDILVSSDLGRAKRTSEIINKHLQLKTIENRDIRERAFGVMEGLSHNEIRLNYPTVLEAYLSREVDYPLTDGESLVEFNKRVISGINSIAKTYKDKNVLMVSHGGVLDCVIRKVFNQKLNTERCFSIYNTSVNTISISGNKWLLEEWGNIEHLNKNEVLDEIK